VNISKFNLSSAELQEWLHLVVTEDDDFFYEEVDLNPVNMRKLSPKRDNSDE
jgi:hypothetical protein